jgi:hypothetical protein
MCPCFNAGEIKYQRQRNESSEMGKLLTSAFTLPPLRRQVFCCIHRHVGRIPGLITSNDFEVALDEGREVLVYGVVAT